MNRQLNLYEILLMIGGANVVLGLTVFGSKALYFGLALLAIGAASALYFSNRAAEASRPKEIELASVDAALNEIDDASRALALSGDGWVDHQGTWSQSLSAVPADDEPFRIDCSVASSGEAELVLIPGGEQRETIFELFPFGPSVPFGCDEFLRLAKALGGSTSSFDLSGLLSSPAPIPVNRADPERKRPTVPDRVPVDSQPAARRSGRLNRFCTSCGAAFDREDLFCTDCGATRGTKRNDGSRQDEGRTPMPPSQSVGDAGAATSGSVEALDVLPQANPFPLDEAHPSGTGPVHTSDGLGALRGDDSSEAVEQVVPEGPAPIQSDQSAVFCVSCGADVRSAASYCIRCGHAVAVDDGPANADPDRTVKRRRR